MPYDKNTGIASKPLNTADIGAAIGSGSTDVGTLCSYSGIGGKQRWNLHKPIRFNSTEELPDSTFYALNCGLNLPVYDAGSDIIPYIDENGRVMVNRTVFSESMTKQWNWLAPRGRANNPPEPYRMLDFDGFHVNPAAPLLVSVQTATGQISAADPNDRPRIIFNVRKNPLSQMDIARFARFQDWGLGVLYTYGGSEGNTHIFGHVNEEGKEEYTGELIYPLSQLTSSDSIAVTVPMSEPSIVRACLVLMNRSSFNFMICLADADFGIPSITWRVQESTPISPMDGIYVANGGADIMHIWSSMSSAQYLYMTYMIHNDRDTAINDLDVKVDVITSQGVRTSSAQTTLSIPAYGSVRFLPTGQYFERVNFAWTDGSGYHLVPMMRVRDYFFKDPPGSEGQDERRQGQVIITISRQGETRQYSPYTMSYFDFTGEYPDYNNYPDL